MASFTISVIIPFYNTYDYLEECLSSVVNATYGKGIPSEILLINDNSTDKSLDIAQQFCKEYSFIRCLDVDEETRGPGRARNIGLDEACGEFIAFVDSDDVVMADIYERALASLALHGSDVCICDASRLHNQKQTFSVAHNRAFSHVLLPCTSLNKSPSLIFGAFCWNSVVRRRHLVDNGIRYPENTLYEDFLYCLQLLHKAKKISIVRNVEYLWRRRESSLSITQSYLDEQNFQDRTEMNKQVLLYAKHHIRESKIINVLYTKILMLYPDTMLSLTTINRMSDERLSERIQAMAAFAQEYIPTSAYSHIPIIHEQLWRDILCININNVRRSASYRTKNYYSIPINRVGEHFEMLPNPSIVNVDRRNVKNDFTFSIPICYIRSVSSVEDILYLSGWLYFKRISVPNVGDQDVRAFLYNDITGERISLATEVVSAQELMKGDVSIFNYDDYSSKAYDYTGSGFIVSLDIHELLDNVKCGQYLILLEYENPLKSGARILRGIHKETISQMIGTHAKNSDRELSLSVDPRQTLQLTIREKKESKELASEISAPLPSSTMIASFEEQLKQMECAHAEEVRALTSKLLSEKAKNKALRESKTFRFGQIALWVPIRIAKLFKSQ